MAKNSHDYALHGQKKRKNDTSIPLKPKNCMVKSHGRSYTSHGNNSVVEKSSMKNYHVKYYENHRYRQKKSNYYQAFFILHGDHVISMGKITTYTSVGIM
jgi:ubiquitin